MDPKPPPDGGITEISKPDQPKPQENQYPPSVQILIQAQKKVDEQIEALYPPQERRSLLRGIEGAKKDIRIFHKQETDILDADGKLTGNKRVTIVSSRPSQHREGE